MYSYVPCASFGRLLACGIHDALIAYMLKQLLAHASPLMHPRQTPPKLHVRQAWLSRGAAAAVICFIMLRHAAAQLWVVKDEMWKMTSCKCLPAFTVHACTLWICP